MPWYITAVLVASALLSACNRETYPSLIPEGVSANELHRRACMRQAVTPASAWHISSLYDCVKGELYIPYQLWTGASWDGRKRAACMHRANSRFWVNGRSETIIRGPLRWVSPESGAIHQAWSREKTDGSKVQLFTCHERGIGRVFDSRGDRYYDPGRCKFPAGGGWKLGVARACDQTRIEIIHIELDTRNRLAAIHFKWWVHGRLDYIYRYAPNKSMTHAWKQ